MAQGFDFKRDGEVVCECLKDVSGIKTGDKVYFHHHIAMEEIDHEGVRGASNYIFDLRKRWYKVPINLVYAYERDGKFIPVDGYCFLEPEINYQIDPKKYPNIIIPNNEKEEISLGKIKYGCQKLYDLGIHEGDLVYFTSNSKYPMRIGEDNLWRMEVDWILAKA